jgi:hypothetical protein
MLLEDGEDTFVFDLEAFRCLGLVVFISSEFISTADVSIGVVVVDDGGGGDDDDDDDDVVGFFVGDIVFSIVPDVAVVVDGEEIASLSSFLSLLLSSESLVVVTLSFRAFLLGGPVVTIFVSSSPSLLEDAGDPLPPRLVFRCFIGTLVAKILYSNFGSIVQKAPFPESLLDLGILIKALFNDKL